MSITNEFHSVSRLEAGSITTNQRHIRDNLGRTNFFCHTYDTSMTIIVTKPGIIIDVVGSYFYDKKIMTENGLFVLGGLETQLHDILWAVHDGKNHGRSEGEENFGEFPVTVGGRGPSDARFSRTRMRVCARRWL